MDYFTAECTLRAAAFLECWNGNALSLIYRASSTMTAICRVDFLCLDNASTLRTQPFCYETTDHLKEILSIRGNDETFTMNLQGNG